MTSDAFNIDHAEDFDDGTRAIVHEDASSVCEDELASATRLGMSFKHANARDMDKQREQVSELRVKNWDAEGVMGSNEYAGKVVKRADLKDGMESPDEDAMAEWSDAEPFGASDDEEEQVKEGLKRDQSEDSEDEGNSVELLVRSFQKEDSARLISVQNSDKVVQKAVHVRNQKLIWERCLEAQIYTKRLLATIKDAVAYETVGDLTDDETTIQSKEKVISDLYKCIDAVSSLQTKLCNVSELSAPDLPTKKRKRTCDDLWQEITTSNQAMLPQYNDILNTYMRKTDLLAGGKNNQGKKFKAVNQDILTQVESVLVDPQRVKRKAHAPVDAKAPEAVGGEEDQLDELVYDDSDFYQQLLKEYIENGGGANQDAIVRRTHRKKKKLVNRKASKGRQLRYTVHPKLENFMFPEPYPTPEMDVDELFRSLFGQIRH
ncbi:apoptosis antagonizing transcription factor [Plasmopara halstedii]|uniref:Apoptosis antagonizing transcription factor n=1 Tax=Plasmopara halstedii TaxID=4781 RepID=A0A0P1ATV0_PLAHL|nr:apoptosis antagonizing transcription factor [Plasmopara halstedii]CEG44759.1 apoptosis antagonizing transcription factor [Plasmopara halstedii]|eukprot:XP_024581128.1 apoptosis antagonizing transcription factor [Plasmopara halstedii]